MFAKILIANRGEIAVRVIKTARRMGIKTVAVYSQADAQALHVRLADEGICIGGPRAYLDRERMVEACMDSGADAVHPGYGFLSERAAFAEALQKAGIVFIGPNPAAIAAMGDKIESKKLAKAAGVSTVPGFLGEITDAAHARAIAEEIGYPVMVKASAGGGGKGLRIVTQPQDLVQAIQSSRNEAQAGFGDGRLLVEKFVAQPRHIEIQVMADRHGHVLHLNERECSIQRRHQKVIEEAPSPFLDEKTRAAMGAQAVALAKAVNYDSAGTVEFIMDGARNFYFLEMNTRLQVEHPVTELITGLDLVELMIRAAAGEKLPLAQKDVRRDGWAIEARVYAEDPRRGFLPSTGRLTRYRPPAEAGRDGITIRNDTGVREGGEISVHYDPMIAKLCVHAPARDQAVAAMGEALDRFEISGIANNLSFLGAIMRNPRFQEGRLTTGFIAEEFPQGFKGAVPDKEAARMFVAAAVAAKLIRTRRAGQVTDSNGGLKALNSFLVSLGGNDHAVCDAHLDGDTLTLAVDGKTRIVTTSWFPGRSLMVLKSEGRQTTFQIARQAGGYRLAQGGAEFLVTVRSPLIARLAALMPQKPVVDTSRLLLCPMPGLVTAIHAAVGQVVQRGAPLAVVEAMKMENVLLAERDGVIARIFVKKGDSLARDDMILEFK